jgi:chromosome segregation ATPase
MSDIVERLRHSAGDLINGTVEDGGIEVAMLGEAADTIERMNAALLQANHECNKADLTIATLRIQVERMKRECDHWANRWQDEHALVERQRKALNQAELALDQAQDCINAETPEDITFGEAEDDTISKIREAMRTIAAVTSDER